MYLNLYDKFYGMYEGWKEAAQMIDDMIAVTDDQDRIYVLKEVKENAEHEVDTARHVYDDFRDKRIANPLSGRQRKNYGRMHGCEESLDFVRTLPESDKRDWTLRRMEYEFDRERRIKPTFRKGVYGKKYDNYSCGNCGYGGIERHENYCPNCGYAIGWEIKYEPDEETEEEPTVEGEQTTIFDIIGGGENGNQ